MAERSCFRRFVLWCFLGLTVSSGCGPGGGQPIPLAPGACRVPLFIGEAAERHPLRPQFIPAHPYLFQQGKNGMHADSYCTDTYPWSGPLGLNPQVRSASMAALGGLVATVGVDGEGRLVCVSGSLLEFRLLLLDPETLQVLASHTLPQRASTREFWETGDWRVIMSDTSGGAYFHLDRQGRPIIANADKVIQVFRAARTDQGFEWRVEQEIDLKSALPEDAQVTDAMPDWFGRIWFVTRTGIVGVVQPQTAEIRTLLLPGEEIQNTMAVARDGVYIVSDHALYRFQTSLRGSPEYTWRKTYDRGTFVKPGAISQGSGTTPTLLGGDLVAITDNADEQVHVLVYRRLPGVAGERLVCGQAVFDPGFSVSENSLIGYGRSLIVENNYAYGTGLPLDPDPRSHPGVTRIDVVDGPGGTECRVAWESREASQTTVPKLSIGNGLVYLYTRLEEAPDDILAWYLTAIDFKTGRTVFKIFTGTGILWNNSYAPITLGPDGTAYVGVYNGFVAVRDGREGEAPRDLGCPSAFATRGQGSLAARSPRPSFRSLCLRGRPPASSPRME